MSKKLKPNYELMLNACDLSITNACNELKALIKKRTMMWYYYDGAFRVNVRSAEHNLKVADKEAEIRRLCRERQAIAKKMADDWSDDED